MMRDPDDDWTPESAEAWKGEEDVCGPDCSEGVTLLLPFLTSDVAFVHGWEACQLWEALKRRPAKLERYIHCANDEQCLLIAARCGYTATIDVLVPGSDDEAAPTWARLSLTYNTEA